MRLKTENYELSIEDYGIKMILKGKFTEEDFSCLLTDARRFIVKVSKPFNLLTVATELKPFNGIGHATLLDLQTLALKYGMDRNAKVLTDDGIALWADLLGYETGMIDKEKRFDNIEAAETYLRRLT